MSIGLAVLGIATLLAMPWACVRLPADYFTRRRAPVRRGWGSWLVLILKNTLGSVLLLLGVAMLLLPGQGLLTIFVALLLLDLPGKRRAMRWIILRPRVSESINSMRRRAGRPPLELGDAATPSSNA